MRDYRLQFLCIQLIIKSNVYILIFILIFIFCISESPTAFKLQDIRIVFKTYKIVGRQCQLQNITNKRWY